MRILHMIGSLKMGGSQTMMMALYRAVDKEKVQFDFIVDCEEESVFAEEIEKLGGKIFRFPKFNGKNYGQIRSVWKTFFTEHPEYKVLHSHVRSYASLYLPIARSFGVKTIIHSHNTSNGHGVAALGKKILQYPLRFQADYFFGCSELAGQWLFGKKVVESDRYFMLKNAVDMDRFSFRQETRDRIREELAVDEKTLLIGHVGRMHPQKNHHFLLECFSEIVARNNDVRLMLLGEGDLWEEIVKQVQQLGLQEHVILLGMRKNVEDYMQAMDCLVLPSLHEGLPVVIVEAQANGLKCFVSDTVTKEVQLSELVRYLPINQGTKIWADAVLSTDGKRMDVSGDISRGGFSVKESAAWLSNFYMEIASGLPVVKN